MLNKQKAKQKQAVSPTQSCFYMVKGISIYIYIHTDTHVNIISISEHKLSDFVACYKSIKQHWLKLAKYILIATKCIFIKYILRKNPKCALNVIDYSVSSHKLLENKQRVFL